MHIDESTQRESFEINVSDQTLNIKTTGISTKAYSHNPEFQRPLIKSRTCMMKMVRKIANTGIIAQVSPYFVIGEMYKVQTTKRPLSKTGQYFNFIGCVTIASLVNY